MRRAFLLVTLLCPIVAAEGQRRTSRIAVPADVRQSIEDRWNGVNALRSRDSVHIASYSRPVEGNVAVQNGPLVIGGRVTGNVLAVNSDVTMLSGARVDGDLWIVGGRLHGGQNGTVAGEIRIYEARVGTRWEGEQLFVVTDDDRRPGRTYGWSASTFGRGWHNPIYLATAGAYNRVEGLPINIGPSIFYQDAPWGSLKIDAFGIVRTGSTFDDDGGDVGHDIRTEMRFGRRTGPAFGGRLYNTIEPVESWQLSEIETSLAAFLFRRDYRDYFANRGVTGFARLYIGSSASVTGSFSDQRWDTRDLFNPFTIFRGDATWRPNPTMDVGQLHIGHVTLEYDTRIDEDDPRSGLYVVMDAEHGQGQLTSVAPSSWPRGYADGARVSYNRGFLDARSYHVLSPASQVSFRVVGGGWLSGDKLPLQRRLSVAGTSALPGYDFRSVSANFDAATCSVGPGPIGRPAECERIALAQVEYRGDLHIDIGDWREDAGRYIGARGDASWVVFLDAGRGWMIGDTPGDETTYGAHEFPPLETFRSDAGVGLEFGGLGVYLAKSLSQPDEPLNFFVRLHRRF